MADLDKEVEVTLELSDGVLRTFTRFFIKEILHFDLVCEIIQKSLVDEDKES